MKEIVRKLLSNDDFRNGLIAFGIVILTFFLASLFPNISTEMAGLFSIALLLIFLAIPILRDRSYTKIIILIALVILVFLSILNASQTITPKTSYIIVDASEEGTIFPGFTDYLISTANQAEDDRDLGLMVFGGSIGGSIGCNDIVELVNPKSKINALKDIESLIDTFNGVEPQGPQAIQGSILSAMQSLADSQRSGPHRIYLITTGLGIECGSLNRESVDLNASRHGDFNYEIVVIAIGLTDETTIKTLEDFADLYQPVDLPEEIPGIISELEQQSFQNLNTYYGNYR